MSKNIKIVLLLSSTLLLYACGGGASDDSTSNATNTVTDTTPPATTDTTTTTSGAGKVKNQRDAARFLTRSTFGPTQKSINDLLVKETYENWINDQFNTSPTYHFPKVKSLATKMCADKDDNGQPLVDTWEAVYPRHQIWWETATTGKDQLRQRVALALSEILVISDSNGLGLSDFQFAVTSYYDVLVKHAFGNYRNLLEDVTLHPAMGDFLSMSRNQKANEEGTIRPDENYAREALQLFTIGVHELNIDGTEKLDGSNNPIPTYDQKKIEEFAKVFTGWSYTGKDWYEYFGNADHTKPLIAFEEYHDKSAKKLLNGAQSPANQSAKDDLDFALDNIFAHANLAPFISKQLIKRLITSNPSPAYVARVANKFNDNGSGIKGDMKAVVTAILLDEDALAATNPDNFGKLREPMLRMSHLWRNFNMQPMLKVGHYWESDKRCGQGTYSSYNFYDSLDSFAQKVGQGPLQARSVFNFFRPDYSPNGVLNDNGISAPEFQIINENTMVAGTNLFHQLIEQFSESKPRSPALNEYSKFNLEEVSNLASDTEKLLNYLDLVLLNKEMSSSLRTILTDHLNTADVYSEGKEGQFEKAREAILLIVSSPEYLIQR
jgi:uncharacterized protein (DUF1800 family)